MYLYFPNWVKYSCASYSCEHFGHHQSCRINFPCFFLRLIGYILYMQSCSKTPPIAYARRPVYLFIIWGYPYIAAFQIHFLLLIIKTAIALEPPFFRSFRESFCSQNIVRQFAFSRLPPICICGKLNKLHSGRQPRMMGGNRYVWNVVYSETAAVASREVSQRVSDRR